MTATTATTSTETVRDLAWYTANFGAVEELRAKAELATQAARDATRIANDAVRNATIVGSITEMFEGLPLAVENDSPTSERVAVYC